jgi:hypothetical protein
MSYVEFPFAGVDAFHTFSFTINVPAALGLLVTAFLHEIPLVTY